MECVYYNINHGYVEGIVRGYRNELLTAQNYNNLAQCAKLEDVKLQLTPTYGEVYSDLPTGPGLTTSLLSKKATEKLVRDFNRLRCDASGSLSRFLDYITYGYMIDNIAMMIKATVNNRDTDEFLEKCHALGWFETMPALTVATNVEELYDIVLVETPLAKYFQQKLTKSTLNDVHIEVIRNTLYKAYLEDFHRFVTIDPELAGTATAETMSELLEFEADRRAINITINSFNSELSKEERDGMYPSFGRLYPEGTAMLLKATSVEGVLAAIEGVNVYADMFKQTMMNGDGAHGSGGKSLEDLFYEREMELCKQAFTRQFSHSSVYAWVRMKEQEIRNVNWISECIAQHQKDRINNYIAVL